MVHPAHNQVRPPALTYGALLGDSVAALAEARQHDLGPFRDAILAADTVSDYERFLAVSGRHLQLLLGPTPVMVTRDQEPPRRLVSELGGLRLDRRGGNAWARAGDALGLAHDVLATHVGPRGERRSPESLVLSSVQLQHAAVDRMIGLLREPLGDAKPLLRHASAAQPPTDASLDPDDAGRVRLTAAKLTRLLAQPTAVVGDDALDRLDRLTPVQTKLDDTTPVRVLSAISTLHLLRQLIWRQSEGAETANAHTLQELCRLAVLTCRTAEDSLPYPTTPLGRVDRAAAIDHLRLASASWGDLGGRLYPQIQGLAKAPGVYHLAITKVTDEATTSAVAARAVLSCLPRLALQSATTVARLHNRHELVTCSRAPGDLTARWRPLTPAEARALADGFAAAGRATRRASKAVRRQVEPSVRRTQTVASVQRRTRGLEVER